MRSFLHRRQTGSHRVLAGVAVIVLIALAAYAPRLVRLATGRLPEFVWLWQWQRDYETLLTRSSTPSSERLALGSDGLVEAAVELAARPTRYDPAFVPLSFPGGDVPADTGVCTDLVIRALRQIDIDLQEAVHHDMRASFDAYPALWGSREADPSIDHRRVPNLMVYLARQGAALPISDRAEDYRPGEIITWHLGLGSTHIGIVTDRVDPRSGNPLIAHHVSGRPSIDDVLFEWRIIGRFRYSTRTIELE